MMLLVVIFALVPFTNGVDVACLQSGKGIQVSLDASDYPDWERTNINLGTCSFNGESIATGAADCGVEESVSGSNVVYSVKVSNGAENKLITRRQPFVITVACSYNTAVDGARAVAHIAPTLDEIIGELQASGEFNLGLDVLDGEGEKMPAGEAVVVTVGDAVTLVASGAGEGFVSRATKCWSSSDALGKESEYVLISGSCAEDETVTMVAEGGDQMITFDSFAYTANTEGKVYLHCDLEACPEDDDMCGICLTSQRKRRSVKSQTMMAYNQMKIMQTK